MKTNKDKFAIEWCEPENVGDVKDEIRQLAVITYKDGRIESVETLIDSSGGWALTDFNTDETINKGEDEGYDAASDKATEAVEQHARR